MKCCSPILYIPMSRKESSQSLRIWLLRLGQMIRVKFVWRCVKLHLFVNFGNWILFVGWFLIYSGLVRFWRKVSFKLQGKRGKPNYLVNFGTLLLLSCRRLLIPRPSIRTQLVWLNVWCMKFTMLLILIAVLRNRLAVLRSFGVSFSLPCIVNILILFSTSFSSVFVNWARVLSSS